MSVLPRALLWRRTDTVGVEHTLVSDGSGLHARGVQVGDDPLPYACRYELYTDEGWATARFEATVEGGGFLRTIRMERAAGRWRVTASEQGDLDRALTEAGRPRAALPGAEDPLRLSNAVDMDLAYSPLTNTLPVRRLGLLSADPGTTYTIEVAWVVLPSLEVIPSTQSYIGQGSTGVRFTSGMFTADLELDVDGYVVSYPGLASRA
jgi:hypothetical protein